MRAWTNATLGLVVAVLCLSGCQVDAVASALPSGPVDYCTIVADPPIVAGKKIAAPAHYTCDGKGADTITITVTLEQAAANGSWRTLSTATFVAHGTNTSRARTLGTRTKRVFVACASGHFRTVTHAIELSNRHTQTYDSHSVTARNPCSI
jgi:hypothetical protein